MRIPLLLYHDIKPDDFNVAQAKPEYRPYILRQSDFLAQMEWLREHGYRAVSLHDINNILEEDISKTACIVFDDGLVSNIEIAKPILERFGFKATFFITVENVGKENVMNWQQIKELAESGMEIESHNLTHEIPIDLSDEDLEYGMVESKRILEEKISKKIEFFSLPTGFYDKRIEQLAKKAGYKGMCYSEVGLNSVQKMGQSLMGQSLFLQLKKIGIKRDYNMPIFQSIVEGNPGILAILRGKQMVRNVAKSVLGAGNYIRLKSFILKRAV